MTSASRLVAYAFVIFIPRQETNFGLTLDLGLL